MLKREVNRKRIAKIPPFYNLHDDNFYHGPAWVIKPKIFQPKENNIQKPGPAYYHIPDRSIYARPGKTIGGRYESSSSISTNLLAHYYPNDHYTSKSQIPSISITPRRIELTHNCSYSRQFYFSSNPIKYAHVPVLRPLYGPIISRKSFKHHSPGPATYPIYEFDEDILPQSQPGFTQKHRYLSDRKVTSLKINPPFYYPNISNHHRLPSFTIGKRLFKSTKMIQCLPPYYKPVDKKNVCSTVTQPGFTLKGRWSPSVYIGINQKTIN